MHNATLNPSTCHAITTNIMADRMGGVRCKYGREISCRILVGKLKGKRPLGRAEENTTMDPK